MCGVWQGSIQKPTAKVHPRWNFAFFRVLVKCNIILPLKQSVPGLDLSSVALHLCLQHAAILLHWFNSVTPKFCSELGFSSVSISWRFHKMLVLKEKGNRGLRKKNQKRNYCSQQWPLWPDGCLSWQPSCPTKRDVSNVFGLI